MKAELYDEESIKKTIYDKNNLHQIANKDFPIFLTVKKLIFMIDGSLNFPFFKRNEKGEVMGLDQNNLWHNEGDGVLMINNYESKISLQKKSDQHEELHDSDDDQDVDDIDDEDIEEEYERQIFRQFVEKRK